MIPLLFLASATSVAMDHAREQWRECLYSYTAMTYAVPDPSNLIVEGALTNCDTKEMRFKKAIRAHWLTFSPGNASQRAAEIVSESRTSYRETLIVDVQLHRASDPRWVSRK